MDGIHLQRIHPTLGLRHSWNEGDDSAEDYENVPTSHASVFAKESEAPCVAQSEQQALSDHEYVNTERRKTSAVSRSYLRANDSPRYDPQGEGTVGKNYVNVAIELTPMNTAKASIVESGASRSAKPEHPLSADTLNWQAGQTDGLYANFPSTSAEEYCKMHRLKECVNLPASQSNNSSPIDKDQVTAAQVDQTQNTSSVLNEFLQPCENLTKDLSPADSNCPQQTGKARKSPVVLDRHHAWRLACLLIVFVLISICSGILAGIAFNKAISTNVDYPLQWQALSLNDQHASQQQGEKMCLFKGLPGVSQPNQCSISGNRDPEGSG